MIHSQERRKIVYSRSLHSVMNWKKRGRLCKDYWQPFNNLSAIRRRFSFFMPFSSLHSAFFVAIENHLRINTLNK